MIMLPDCVHVNFIPSAKNIHDVDIAVRKMRSINDYFESSTQAMSKLLNFQSSSNIKEYNEHPKPKKTLQDVETSGQLIEVSSA